jgi:CubicO group peptidase (beta-lactamase class C family)
MVHPNFTANMSAKFVNNCLKFSLVAVFLLFQQLSFSQSSFPLLDKTVEEKKKALGNDFTVMVTGADTITYQKTAGDLPPKTPVPIGALSQWLTTAVVLQLADEGKLSLDDKISKYLPVFESYRKGYITIRHCLSHQTGIGTEGFKLAALFEKEKFNTLEEAVPNIAKKEIHANAGEQFRYSNYGIVIAARIVEIVSKKRFDQFIRAKLFVPLAMRNTSFTTDDGSAPNPAMGAKSTAMDYSRFLQMLLKGGKVGEKQILTASAIEELRKVQVRQDQISIVPKVAEGFGFALGSWMTEGNKTVGEKATALALPGLTGTWAMLDFARNYAFVVISKNIAGEQKSEAYVDLKKAIDQQVPVKK